MESDYLIKLDSVSFETKKNLIVDKLNLKVVPNEFSYIIGPNGGGKSSLIKLILGINKASHGKISTQKNLSISYVPQKLHFSSTIPMTVKGFLSIMHPLGKDDFNFLVNLNLTELLDYQVHDLSGGQAGKVMLARALLKQPKLLILDEPCASLDFQAKVEFYQLLEDIFYQQQGLSVLLVSHDLEFIFRKHYKLEVGVLGINKSLKLSGSPKDVAESAALLSLFNQATCNKIKDLAHKFC